MKKLISTIFLLIFLARAPAQSAFEDVGLGARASGMGEAFTAVADDLYAFYYNPSGLSRIAKSQIGLTYTSFYPGLNLENAGDVFVGCAFPLKFAGFSLGWINSHMGTLYTENSYYLSIGSPLLSHFFANPALKNLHLGLNLKMLSLKYNPSRWAVDAGNNWQEWMKDPVFDFAKSKSAIGVDLGLLCQFSKNYFLGISLQNINTPDIGLRQLEILPLLGKIGFSYKQREFILAADVSYSNKDYSLQLGSEKWFEDIFALRAGFGYGSRNYLNFSLGLSCLVKFSGATDLRIDYAFLYPLNELTNTLGSHRLGIIIYPSQVTKEQIFIIEEKPSVAEKEEVSLAEEEVPVVEEKVPVVEEKLPILEEKPLVAEKEIEKEKEEVKAALEELRKMEGVKIEDNGIIIITCSRRAIAFYKEGRAIRPQDERLLALVATVFRHYKEEHKKILVHTSLGKDSVYDAHQTTIFARTLMENLLKKGVSPQNFFEVGVGSWKPVADNSTFAGRQKNRRVEFYIWK